MEVNLDSMIFRYEEAICQNTSMSNELAFERDRIIALRDSIKDLKGTNYNLIRRYRKEIAKLEEKNKELFTLNEMLTNKNMLLTSNLDSARVNITRQIAVNDTLLIKNLELTEKVAIGSTLKINSVKAITMKERSSGKLVETNRSSRTDAFRVSFRITENELAELGAKKVHIQIKNLNENSIRLLNNLFEKNLIKIYCVDINVNIL